MKREYRFLLVILFLLELSLVACRSRRSVPAPEAVPTVPEAAVTTQVAEPVPPPESDFAAPADERDVISDNIDEANRQARERGWIRDAFFAVEAFTLDGQAQDALRHSAAWLSTHPEFALRIEGHCDERGTEQYNLALGDRRANAARDFLTASGLRGAQIQTVSYGEERPFEPGSTEEAWAQNRRAHLVLVRSQP